MCQERQRRQVYAISLCPFANLLTVAIQRLQAAVSRWSQTRVVFVLSELLHELPEVESLEFPRTSGWIEEGKRENRTQSSVSQVRVDHEASLAVLESQASLKRETRKTPKQLKLKLPLAFNRFCPKKRKKKKQKARTIVDSEPYLIILLCACTCGIAASSSPSEPCEKKKNVV